MENRHEDPYSDFFFSISTAVLFSSSPLTRPEFPVVEKRKPPRRKVRRDFPVI